MHTNTDAKWDQIRELNPFVKEMLPYKHNEKNNQIEDTRDIIDEYEDPIHIMATKVRNSMANYQNHYFVTPDLDYLSKPIPSLKKTNFLF